MKDEAPVRNLQQWVTIFFLPIVRIEWFLNISVYWIKGKLILVCYLEDGIAVSFKAYNS